LEWIKSRGNPIMSVPIVVRRSCFLNLTLANNALGEVKEAGVSLLGVLPAPPGAMNLGRRCQNFFNLSSLVTVV
jgi:hypothetical protein